MVIDGAPGRCRLCLGGEPQPYDADARQVYVMFQDGLITWDEFKRGVGTP